MNLPEPTLSSISNTLNLILGVVQKHDARFDKISQDITLEFKRIHERLSEHDRQFERVFEALHELYGLFEVVQALSDHIDEQNNMLRSEMKTEFAAVRSEMKTEFATVRSEMKTEFATVRLEMKDELAVVRSETKTDFAVVRSETRGEFAVTRKDLARIERSLETRGLEFSALNIRVARLEIA